MGTLETYDQAKDFNGPFSKYGLEFINTQTLRGPKRPPLSSITPAILSESESRIILSDDKTFLEKFFSGDHFSFREHEENLMSVVSKIFTSVTNQDLNDYVKLVVMESEDWETFKIDVPTNVDFDKSFNAVNLGGLVVMEEISDDRMLPLIFHEIGHTLYPSSADTFTDELRAYYFQRVSTEILHDQLRKIGLAHTYPDNDLDQTFPSASHRIAYIAARALYRNKVGREAVTARQQNSNLDIHKLWPLVLPTQSFT